MSMDHLHAPVPASPPLDELTTLDWRLLMLEDVPCESVHSDPRNRVCSGGVVARYRALCGSHPVNVCAAASDYDHRLLADPVTTCARCGDPCRDCWSLAPI